MSSEISFSQKEMNQSPMQQMSPFNPSYQSRASESPERQRSCSLLRSGSIRRLNEEFASNIIAELIEKAKMLSGELKNSNEISRELLLENKRLRSAYELLKGKFFTLLAKSKDDPDSGDAEQQTQAFQAFTLQVENEILRIEKLALASELKYVNTHIVDPDYFHPHRRATQSQEATPLKNSTATENNNRTSHHIQIQDLQNEITKLNLLLEQNTITTAQIASERQQDLIRQTRRLKEPVSQNLSSPEATSEAVTPARTPKVSIDQIYQNSAIQRKSQTVVVVVAPTEAAPVGKTVIAAPNNNKQLFHLVSSVPQAMRNNKLSIQLNNQTGTHTKASEANLAALITSSKHNYSSSHSDVTTLMQDQSEQTNKNLSQTNHNTNKTSTITILQNYGSTYHSVPYSQNTLNYNSAPLVQQKAISVISQPEYISQKPAGAQAAGVNETLKSSNKLQSTLISIPAEMKRQPTGNENKSGNADSNREIIVPVVHTISRKQSSSDLKNSTTQITTIIRNTQAIPQQDNLKKSGTLQKESTRIVIPPQLPLQIQQQLQQKQMGQQQHQR